MWSSGAFDMSAAKAFLIPALSQGTDVVRRIQAHLYLFSRSYLTAYPIGEVPQLLVSPPEPLIALFSC